MIQAAAKVQQRGENISRAGYTADGWMPASVPSTVLGALVGGGEYKNLYIGRNLEKVSTKPFRGPWWYRITFDLTGFNGLSHFQLCFDGINYRANVWLNGEKIASASEVFGTFRLFELDISNHVRSRGNVLAVEVFPPQSGEFSIGFVDWNPRPPDANLGIWRGVRIRGCGSVLLNDVFVRPKVNTKTLDEAELTITANLKNVSGQPQEAKVEGRIGAVVFQQAVYLKGGEERLVEFHPQAYQQLIFKDPRLWWPVHMGEPNLYTLRMGVKVKQQLSDTRKIRFGIRQVEDYIDEQGHRGYMINGQKVLIRGGGWVDDLLLSDDEERVEAQMRYARHMNLNTLRLEGFWGNGQALYDLADKYGILLMAGWSCHWEWKNYLGKEVDQFGGIKTPEEMDLISRSFRDQVRWLRNHPSIFAWVLGSDRLPRPELEKRYRRDMKETDPTRPLLAACRALESDISGPTGVKMTGPYDYVTPNYWYEDRKYGGAFGFNTETGPGPQPPPLESLRRMIPREMLWPINDVWNFHCARNKYDNIKIYENALNHRYGKSQNVEEFLTKSQAASYEAIRAMFEAYRVRKPVATGVIQWMYNSAWPAIYWQLYDYYLMPNGAFYGTRKANQPLSLIYDYQTNQIHLVNALLHPVNELQVELRLVNLAGRVIWQKYLEKEIAANGSQPIFTLPDVKGLSPVYFLDLKLKNAGGSEIANNFYWLSRKKDRLDFNRANWFVTPNKSFADFKSLDTLPQVSLQVNHRFETVGKKELIYVTLENNSNHVAFFIEMKVVDQQTKQTILPVFWQDNYISLLPGERKTLQASFFRKDVRNQVPVFTYDGWNVAGN